VTDYIARLKVGSTELPIATHHLGCTVQVERHPSGRRKVRIQATGFYPPDLSAVTWTGAVTLSWRDLADADAAWSSLAILSAGLQQAQDLDGVTCQWSIEGWEASGLSALVTLGSTNYWAAVSVSPIGGVIQRKSNGAGVLLSAWGKSAVRIEGESGAAPSVVAGTLSVTSTLYTGSILVRGLTKSLDPLTGLVRWSIEGEQP
jgi:hypothetical protein